MSLLTVSEVAQVLRVPRARAYALIREGMLPAVRIGRQLRVAEDALAEWIAQGGQALPGGWKRAG
jgi:excisionase family DNA binding protein